jgi:hypothetical protein
MKCTPLVLALLLGTISINAVKIQDIEPDDTTNVAASIDQQVEEGAVKLGDDALDEMEEDILMFQNDMATPEDDALLDVPENEEDYMQELLDLDIEDEEAENEQQLVDLGDEMQVPLSEAEMYLEKLKDGEVPPEDLFEKDFEAAAGSFAE